MKPDAIEELHKRRKEEMKVVFKYLKKHFNKGLEIGAGDGYQSKFLAKHVNELICTEYVTGRLPKKKQDNITYKTLNAQKIEQEFNAKEFDFVFSSNVLEHLPDINSFLNGLKYILTDDGISVHIMPNRFWKITQMLGHHFNYFLLLLEVLQGKRKASFKESYDNHEGVKKHSNLRRVLWPIPHGISPNNWQEFLVFGKRNWKKTFEKNGFRVIDIKKGPVSSGYSIGFTRIKTLLERLGFCSVFVYFIKKSD